MPKLRLRLVAAVSMVLVSTALVAAFPPAPPNDPLYPPSSCPPDFDCNQPTGQWNLFSFSANLPVPTLHPSGISADLAWDVTLGRDDVVVVVLDSGVNYDHEDLRNKIWLNCGELPAPQDAGGLTLPGVSPGCREPGATYDLNGDGIFNIQDYAADPRLTDPTLSPGILSRGDLRTFANGIDDDGNGFIDDISGWDARDGDGDEYRTNGDGHGTGRNGFIAAETDNGAGLAGICPKCRLANVRVDGSFVTRTEGPAIGAIWAADNGHEVINMALGATSASSMARAAFDYATRKNVLALNASANEFSFHHNFQTVFDDVMAIGGVVPDVESNVTTYLRKANFSNYGAHLDVVTPSDAPTTGGGNASYGDSSGTSSAVPHAAGVAALVFSRARELIDATVLDTSALALKDISAQEVRQILNRTADDVVQTDDPLGPYPYLPGWDRWTGYGRLNARAAVDRVGAGTIPPEADINRPDWYTKNTGTVSVDFYANARWASSFDWVLEVGAGVEPASFSPLASGSGVAANPALSSANLVSNFSVPWNAGALADGFYTLRLRVTDDLGNLGEDRMGVWVQAPDPQDHPGWPKSLPASIESVAGGALVDLDGDNTLEIILSTGDGEVRAFHHDGTELAGFPVRTDPVAALPTCCSDAFDGDPANGEVPIVGASITGGVAVADIDRDGMQEICAGAYDGKMYCWKADGTLQPGFPVETDKGITVDQYGGAHLVNARGEAILVPPTFEDLTGDGRLELVAGAFDQKLYIWRSDGTRLAPWPLQIFDAGSSGGVNVTRPREIISVPVIADIDADGRLEIVFGTNETYGTPNVAGQGGSGRLYAYEVDGTLEPGWPAKPESLSPDAVPLVATGHGTSPGAADLDGDGTLELSGGVLLSDAIIYDHDGTEFARMNGAMAGTGPGGDGEETTPEGGLGKPSDNPVHYYVALGAFADIDLDGQLDYMVGTIGTGIAGLALGSGTPAPFDHFFSVWDPITTNHKPTFPRVMEDWQFFTGPAVADIDGAIGGHPEIIVASGGYFVHAFNAILPPGIEPAGWPKNVGQWVVMSPTVGDLDDDGNLEVVVATRAGDIHVWDTPGPTCGNVPWRKAGHDEWVSAVAGKDTLRPAAIDDLAFSIVGNDVQLDWTAVGDDGRCGTATSYELRASATPITGANFEAATPIALPAPGPSGAAESALVTPPPGALFFALRAVDEAGNAGALASFGLTASCSPTPRIGCFAPAVPGKARLDLRDKTPDSKDRLTWKWVKGAATTKADFGSPLASTDYNLCIYEGATLVSASAAPAGGTCNANRPKPCWKEKRRGFQYVDRDLTPDGIQKIDLKEGPAGKAKIIVRSKGDLIPMPALPIQVLPVTAQLQNSDGACWEATYSTTQRNFGDVFKAKSD